MLDSIGIVSQNIDQTIKFYGILGVQFREEGDTGHFEGVTKTGIKLMIDSEKSIKELYPSWKNPQGCPVVLCFKQSSSEEVERIYNKIVDSGFEGVREPWDAFWGQYYSSVMGPDGNQVDIFSDRRIR